MLRRHAFAHCHALTTAALAATLALPSSPALANDLNVLWYTYSDPASVYRSELLKVAAQAATDPSAHGNHWNITWWNAGTAAPALSGFDVLVTHSGEGFFTADPANLPPLGYLLPNFSTLLASGAAINAARGDRTAIVNSDLDVHSVLRGSGMNLAAGCDPHGQAPTCDFFNGARGQLTNLIDWAGNGRGLGVVALSDGEFLPGGYWWDKPGSFLKDELNGVDHPFRLNGQLRENNPLLTAAESTLALNGNLSSQGLSKWTWGYHGGFTSVPTGYVSTLSSTLYPDLSLVVVSQATAAGALTSAVPEPQPAVMLVLGLAALGWLRHRRGIPARR